MTNNIIIINPANINTGCFGSPIAHIYRVYRKSTGRSYIGSSTNVAQRIQTHFSQLANGNHSINDLQNDYNSNPSDFTAEILDEVFADEIAADFENHYIKKFGGLTFGNVYNVNTPKPQKSKTLTLDEILDKLIEEDADNAIKTLISALSKAHTSRMSKAMVAVEKKIEDVHKRQQIAAASSISNVAVDVHIAGRCKTAMTRPWNKMIGKNSRHFADQLKREEAYINRKRQSGKIPDYIKVIDGLAAGKSISQIAGELNKSIKNTANLWDGIQDRLPAYYVAHGKNGERSRQHLKDLGITNIPE